ncbi:hypothetical protein D7004_12455 [Pedobacter jejuensis]|uniref:Uncharacterized protein n=1 Tax=Pedobacter jejuensis TaxID=1268550 RepID=A0A3N0BTL6_9SPHI|nr:hypothetical protein D7004_12455 [Pedobacter jejuensis]
MSIYFQYPNINEYENLIYLIQTENTEMRNNDVEDRINQQHIEEFKRFFSLKACLIFWPVDRLEGSGFINLCIVVRIHYFAAKCFF